jgi:cell division septum initiation protein DivIVA
MTSLISSSGIGPLRELVRLRQKQELELEQKDLEIEAMQTENAGLNDHVHRLEGELHKAKLENRSTKASSKPAPDPKISALKATVETLRSKINNQAKHITGLSEKCAELKGAARKGAGMNTEKKEQGGIQPSTSTSVDPPSRQPILELVKVTVTHQTVPTPTINTPQPQDPKSDSKSAVLVPPGMGKKAKKKARAAERNAKLATLPLKMVEAIPAGLERTSKYGLDSEAVDQTRRSSPGLSQVSISQKQVTSATRSVKGTSTNLTTLTVRPILRWPNIENTKNRDSVDCKIDLATCARPSESFRSKRAPTGPETLDGVTLNECSMAVRGRGQVQGTRSDDGSSRLRMDAWNACLKSGPVGVKKIEVQG